MRNHLTVIVDEAAPVPLSRIEARGVALSRPAGGVGTAGQGAGPTGALGGPLLSRSKSTEGRQRASATGRTRHGAGIEVC